VSCGHESLPRNSSENVQADANAIICFRVDCTAEFSDLWSVAYHEAVTSLGEEVKGRIMNDEKIDELFAILEEKNDQSPRFFVPEGLAETTSPSRKFQVGAGHCESARKHRPDCFNGGRGGQKCDRGTTTNPDWRCKIQEPL
jgi:hypothetical protein